MTASMEIKGSRKTWGDGRMKFALRLFVSDDGSTSIPVEGDLYPGDSGITARRVVGDPVCEPDVLPGLYYHTVNYAIYKART